jgi:hypothetical protein
MTNLSANPILNPADYFSVLSEAIKLRSDIEREKTEQTRIEAQREVMVREIEARVLQMEAVIGLAIRNFEERAKFVTHTSAQIDKLIDSGAFELAEKFSARVERVLSSSPLKAIVSTTNKAMPTQHIRFLSGNDENEK